MAVNYTPVLYIAGPMRGYDDLNHPAFFAVEKEAKEIGWLVMNPAILPTGLPDSCYPPICLTMLEACDAIYVLPGAENSVGARCEMAYAEVQNITFLYNYQDLINEYNLYQNKPQQISFDLEASND